MRSRWIKLAFTLCLVASPARARDQRRAMADTLKRVVVAKERPSYRANFRLISSEGRAWTLTENQDVKYVALVAWTPEYRFAADLLRWYQFLESAPNGERIRVLYLDPSERQDRAEAQAARVSAGVAGPVLMDYSQVVTRSFGLASVGDFVLVDPETGSEVLRGGPFDLRLPGLLGRGLGWRSSLWVHWGTTKLSFADRALRFLPMGPEEQRHALEAFGKACMKCHQLNPSTDQYGSLADIRGWHEMNRLVMRTSRMPPGGADPESDICLSPYYPVEATEADLGLIQRWIEAREPFPQDPDSGKDPAGEIREELGREIEAESRNYQDRSPDLTFRARTADVIPAEGTIRYVYQFLGGPLPEDLYVKAATLEADTSVLHHAVLYVAPNRPKVDGTGHVVWERKMDQSRIWAKTWEWNAFTMRQRAWPGTAFRIPKGSYLFLQEHYDTIGRAMKNRSKVSFVLAKGSPGRILRKYNFDRTDFAIPPGARSFELVKSHVVADDSSLVAASAHGHFRLGRYYFELKYPDGKVRRLCNVPFHQVQYELLFLLRKPIYVPRGTEIVVHLLYDNSAGNLLNPHPDRWVRNGDFYETDEMDVARLVDVPGRMENAIDLRDQPE